MAEKKYVTGAARKAVARPQPPQGDRRTKRARDRSTQTRLAIQRSFRGDG